jgi:3-dehydroquinate synthase
MAGLKLKMYNLEIFSSNLSYKINISKDLISNIPSNSIVIADDNLKKFFPDNSKVIFIHSDEQNKTLKSCEDLILSLSKLGLKKSDSVVAVGGGLIQDLATLTASIYMRGVKWHYYPTTLMAMADSCIGGKSSINVLDKKNIVGNFYPPHSVQIDLNFLSTLTPEAIASGLCEAIKICFAKGESDFIDFCSINQNVSSYQEDLPNLGSLIFKSLKSKKWFVEVDEFDQKERKLLNFGHTFGHALESATNFVIPHGVAIGIGMLMALKHESSVIGKLENKLEKELHRILQPITLSIKPWLVDFNEKKFKSAFLSDKKHSDEMMRLILPQNGQLVLTEVANNSNNLEYIVNISKEIVNKYL